MLYIICQLLLLLQGLISPNFFAKQKFAGKQKFPDQFHLQLKLQISSLNCRTFYQTFAQFGCQKKLLILFAQKKLVVLMKSTPRVFVWRDEIRCQFHQRFTCSFYARWSQKHQMTLLNWLSFFAHSGSTCVKAVRRTLMKLSLGGGEGVC